MSEQPSEHVVTALTALVYCNGRCKLAAELLKQKQVRHAPPARVIWGWKDEYAGLYAELREKYAPEVEARLTSNLRDVAALASDGTLEAIEAARKKLEDGSEQDPARAAAQLSRVSQAATEKVLALTGRPSQITETRNLGEILRSLASKGVIQIPEQAGEGGDG